MIICGSVCFSADEVDALLGKRREQEHEAITTMKTEFMQLWDGFNTDASANVMVLAATNRPFDLDDAVLRRHGRYPPLPDNLGHMLSKTLDKVHNSFFHYASVEGAGITVWARLADLHLADANGSCPA